MKTVTDLIEELAKEEVRGSGEERITIVTSKQLLPNAHYDVEVGIDAQGRPVLVPTTLVPASD